VLRMGRGRMHVASGRRCGAVFGVASHGFRGWNFDTGRSPDLRYSSGKGGYGAGAAAGRRTNACRTQGEDAELSLMLRPRLFAAGISTRAEALTYGIRR